MKKLAVTALLFLAVPFTLGAQDFRAYQNYDFVPGDKVIFEDDFRTDAEGEFPPHWKLNAGQGVVNKFQGEPVFALTEGNYAKVAPRMKQEAYLGDAFTVEFDFYPESTSEAYDILVLYLKNADDEKQVFFGAEVSTQGLDHDLSGTYPGDAEKFKDKWHHMALVYKNGQLKCYEDQYRVLVVPDVGFKPQSVEFAGIGSADAPIIFKYVRIALGGGMNMLDALTKDGRIVTHGILFDVSKSTIKPASMGTIAQIVKLLKDNPAIKLEVGGHTDADGDAARNLTLSQARADAVKALIVSQGVAADRLTTKGYGATAPVDKNDTPEGKANNRRVEFTKAG